MTIKVTAITVSVFAMVLYILGAAFPNDPYFDLISSNLIVGIGRLLVAGILLRLALKGRFAAQAGPYIARGAGLALIVLGLIGIVVAPVTYALFSLIKPMDYVFLMQTGIIFCLASLTYARGTERFPRISRPRNTQLRLFTPRSA
jgi:hypothetical protein